MKKLALFLFFCGISHFAFSQEPILKASHLHFINYLETILKTAEVTPENTQAFNKKVRKFWSENKLDYNQSPEKYRKTINLFYKSQHKFKQEHKRNASVYKNAVRRFTYTEKRNSLAKKPILFIGSSSIAGWETASAFPELPIINRGLGGIAIPEIIHYYDELIKKHSPSIVVIYCDIDVENGKSPAFAVKAFKTLTNKISDDFPASKIVILSMKPTLIDDFLGEHVAKNKEETNKQLLAYSQNNAQVNFIDLTPIMLNADGRLRADIFLTDGMHLNTLGYSLWNNVMHKALKNIHRDK